MTRFKTYDQFNEGLSMSDIFKSAHGAIDVKNLQKLEDLVGKPKFPSKEEFDQTVEYLGIDKDFLFYNKHDFLTPFIYWKGPIYYGFHGGLNMEVMKMFHAKEALEQLTKYMENAMSKKDFKSIFMRMEKKILIPSFVQMYEQIPDEQKYDIFVDLYVRSEYGFGMFPSEIIKDCFEKRKLSREWKKRMDNFFKKYGKKNVDGYITVYRGENLESAKPDDAFSLTMQEKTAKFFADRFNKGSGKVIKKQIHPEEIIDYLDHRGEAEVILLPKNIRR